MTGAKATTASGVAAAGRLTMASWTPASAYWR
jgi:hypothetical protein